jgi:hypothetical protein
MINALQTGYRRIYDILNRMSPASWIFDRMACLLVATPEELQQASDFWVDNEERSLPSRNEYGLPKVQMQQVGSEYFRRSLRRDLAIFTMIVAMLVSTGAWSLSYLGERMVKLGTSSHAKQERSAVVPASGGQVQPATTASVSEPVAQPRAGRAPVAAPAVSPDICRKLRDDLDPANQRRFITQTGVYDLSVACENQFGI